MKTTRTLFCALYITLAGTTALAQLNLPGATYFQNAYLANAAMAGSAKGLTLNTAFSKQVSALPGSPVSYMLTAEYRGGSNVGIGMAISGTRAGLLAETRTLASYSYRLPLNAQDDGALRFGVSLGFTNQHVDYQALSGDAADVNAIGYNQRQTYVDGDFGIAYTSRRVSLQFALPNLKGFFKTDVVASPADRSTFFASASYKAGAESSVFAIEPKICYRGVSGFGNIIDAGTSVSTGADKVSAFVMYHSSKSATFGIGAAWESLYINGMYTTNTSGISNVNNGNYELSLRLTL